MDKNKKIIIAVSAVIILSIATFLLFNRSKDSNTTPPSASNWSQCSNNKQTRTVGNVTEERSCVECNQAGEWGDCIDGKQSRNNCGVSEVRDCTDCVPQAWTKWSEWGDCLNLEQKRTSLFENANCKPVEQTQDCTPKYTIYDGYFPIKSQGTLLVLFLNTESEETKHLRDPEFALQHCPSSLIEDKECMGILQNNYGNINEAGYVTGGDVIFIARAPIIVGSGRHHTLYLLQNKEPVDLTKNLPEPIVKNLFEVNKSIPVYAGNFQKLFEVVCTGDGMTFSDTIYINHQYVEGIVFSIPDNLDYNIYITDFGYPEFAFNQDTKGNFPLSSRVAYISYGDINRQYYDPSYMTKLENYENGVVVEKSNAVQRFVCYKQLEKPILLHPGVKYAVWSPPMGCVAEDYGDSYDLLGNVQRINPIDIHDTFVLDKVRPPYEQIIAGPLFKYVQIQK